MKDFRSVCRDLFLSENSLTRPPGLVDVEAFPPGPPPPRRGGGGPRLLLLLLLDSRRSAYKISLVAAGVCSTTR